MGCCGGIPGGCGICIRICIGEPIGCMPMPPPIICGGGCPMPPPMPMPGPPPPCMYMPPPMNIGVPPPCSGRIALGGTAPGGGTGVGKLGRGGCC